MMELEWCLFKIEFPITIDAFVCVLYSRYCQWTFFRVESGGKFAIFNLYYFKYKLNINFPNFYDKYFAGFRSSIHEISLFPNPCLLWRHWQRADSNVLHTYTEHNTYLCLQYWFTHLESQYTAFWELNLNSIFIFRFYFSIIVLKVESNKEYKYFSFKYCMCCELASKMCRTLAMPVRHVWANTSHT